MHVETYDDVMKKNRSAAGSSRDQKERKSDRLEAASSCFIMVWMERTEEEFDEDVLQAKRRSEEVMSPKIKVEGVMVNVVRRRNSSKDG